MKKSILSDIEIENRVALATEVARKAGRLVLNQRDNGGHECIGVSQKGQQDFVTEMDKASEELIKTNLLSKFPADGFVGEETEGHVEKNATWVVDPIDGTTNYIRGFDHWAISIALVSNDVVVAGAIYHPAKDVIYSAIANRGALKNGVTLARRSNSDTDRMLAVVGYNYKMSIDEHCQLLKVLHSAGCDFRNLGCAAMDLMDLAEGKVDFTFIHSLNSWDVLAALLIASEAGAVGYCPPLPNFYFGTGPVFAGCPGFVEQVRRSLSGVLSSADKTSKFNANSDEKI